MSSPEPLSFLSAKDAATLVSYTPDYVTKLAREHLIIAEQRGRQWFVDPNSLKLFSLKKEAAARERKAKLREDRLSELAQLKARKVESTSVNRVEQGGLVAFGTTVALTMCLFLLGGVTYVANSEGVTSKALAIGAGTTIERVLEIFGWSREVALETELALSDEAMPEASLMVTKEPLSPEMVERIANSFSDPVDISFVDERTGVITPTFTETDSPESYQFILLPDFTTTP